MNYNLLNIEGAILNKDELFKHIEKFSSKYSVQNNSIKNTFPVPKMMENYEVIKEVYNLLNEHIKLEIPIHPAGEWLLDNFYVIEEVAKSIEKEMMISKYINFVGISNGKYKGFARVYILASEIVNYTDSKISRDIIEDCLKSYQTKKSLSIDEYWNIGTFMNIAIIENIRQIAESIAISQIEKFKVESILERLVDLKDKKEQKYTNLKYTKKIKRENLDVKYPFIEYLSYKLKKYGKKTESYLNILEDEVEKTGCTVSDVIKREHFEMAVKKISIGNCITSIKTLQRINFLEIFEKTNGVEDILKKDPANVYDKMDYKTKEMYRNRIKEISKITKISEIYITRKLLELAENSNESGKKKHIGYYLLDENLNLLFDKLEYKNSNKITLEQKVKIYIGLIVIFTIAITLCLTYSYPQIKHNMWIKVVNFLVLLIPISETVIQFMQYVLSKIVKPKIIPKLDFYDGIPKEDATFVVIPTILNSKEKVKEMFRKMEVAYLANKSKNLYFCLLGDCKESDNEHEKYDEEVVKAGLEEVKRLNKKYVRQNILKNSEQENKQEEENKDGKEECNIFNFIYRKRKYNSKEGKYLGWERKRGALTEFSELLLGNIDSYLEKDKFEVNTIEQKKLPKIKYVITLDSDTDLVLNTVFELVGAMAHILNKPEIKDGKVVSGYGIIQPRIGINLDVTNKSLFTKIFAGNGGIDAYSNAVSDIYQDNFEEGIFTGKGIFDLELYSKILKYEIPENTVLSHDLLEGSYLRCGLATDILLMDGYPSKYNSFILRFSRWIRGDWQIIKWLKNPKLNLLSKYKIFDNLRRSLVEISILFGIIYFLILKSVCKINVAIQIVILILTSILPYLLEFANIIIFKREGEKKQNTFTPKIAGIRAVFYRILITIGCLPFKVWESLNAIAKTLYRLLISKKNLLEWTTSEEAEKSSKDDILNYYRMMAFNIIVGAILIIYAICNKSILAILTGFLFLIMPWIMCLISKEIKEKEPKEKLNKQEIDYIKKVGEKTFNYFLDNLTRENNYLIPDNFQEDRKEKYVNRTSSTNIGLSLMAVQAGYDLGYIKQDVVINLIKNIFETIKKLDKWNGHLYNWYNIKNLKPLVPRYISTVDSGNFVGYLYVTKSFLEEQKKNLNIENDEFEKSTKYAENDGDEKCSQNKERKLNLDSLILEIQDLINKTDFSKLYSKEHKVFSIGFNIEENSLTDSYYDLLASEARQASFLAIAKKDVEAKHWNRLSRTLTVLNNKKGLISWSGTAFEYLMPNINMPNFKGSLLDETSKFAEMCQLMYAKALNIPWGISESAFNVKDLHSNYQYKAFGIPWLGLKRGLADEIVVSSYASVLSITDKPKEVVNNLKNLEKYKMFNKYGFYESIDFSPQRLHLNENYNVVKTYMAHHQALILLSINNLINNNIFQKRFIKNPEIEATTILLQEKMPETFIVTKEEKEKPERKVYYDYENYSTISYKNLDERIIRSNVISNGKYTIAVNQKGQGASKFEDIYINRFKVTDDYDQGIFIYVKNIETKEIFKVGEQNSLFLCSPDQIKFKKSIDTLKTKLKITIDTEEAVEIRNLEIENLSDKEQTLEISSLLEPIISRKEQDYAHPAFNNLFLMFDYDNENNILEMKRRKRNKDEKEYYVETAFYSDGEIISDNEFEIDREKIQKRRELGIPYAIEKSIPFSKKIGLVTEPLVAMRKTIKIKPNEKCNLNLIISIDKDKAQAKENLLKYKSLENVKRAFEISKAKAEAEARYLGITGKEIEIYQKVLGYILFDNPIREKGISKINSNNFSQQDLWKYGISGDLPIILVKIKDSNDIYVVDQILKMYEFFRSKNIIVDLVIMDDEKHSYESYVSSEIEAKILDRHLAYLKNINGGIYVLSKNKIPKKDFDLINFIAKFKIDTHLGDLEHFVKDSEEEYLKGVQNVPNEAIYEKIEENFKPQFDILKSENNKYNNEYGAFSPDGKEYFIKVNKNNKLPTVWCNILANENFGTLVTENMGGYTWHKNSRLNRVSRWSNKAYLDIPSEVIYMEDLKSGDKWSLGQNPMPDENDYNIIYGFGYAKYIHESNGIIQELETFVPNEDSIKINILKLNNTGVERKKIKIVYYIKPVLGEDEIKSAGNIKINYDKNSNIVFAENIYESSIKSKIYVSSSEKIKSFTGEKKFFLGRVGLANPDGLYKERLNNNPAFGDENCIAIELEVEIDSMSSKEIVLNLGANENIIDGKNMAYKYCKINNCKQELENVKRKWKEILEKMQVYTPVESINIMLNGWALYQTISSRLYGKTGFYQSGGAYGFRDQLQDTLCLKYIEPEMMKNQIIKHSKHQFKEGDVEHWWHEETERGIRTRFSDDLLWIVYLVEEYIDIAGDKNILEIKTPYLEGKKLDEVEEERYELYREANVEETLYDHCIKAIEKSLSFGEHGLPKIGTGDWNDGFSAVGNKGKGESIWLGFFMYEIIKRFIKFVEERKDLEKVEKYTKVLEKLKLSLNQNAWDGRWYRRAYCDDGSILGTIENEECKIDSIAQSWSVISGAGEDEKQKISMESLENHLVDKANGIIKLLDPPFNNGKLEPGYIKSYLPGVRENGGQYTHAATWAIIAEAILGNGSKATEFFRMINPIEHARTKDEAFKYKVEPYVIPADIYGADNLAGRGGWTWYTGSSSWFYKAGIEYILGVKIKDNILKMEPCIPEDWKEYSIRYKYFRSIYNIHVKNLSGEGKNVKRFLVDGEEVEEKQIRLDGKGKIVEIVVEV